MKACFQIAEPQLILCKDNVFLSFVDDKNTLIFNFIVYK